MLKHISFILTVLFVFGAIGPVLADTTVKTAIAGSNENIITEDDEDEGED